MHYSMPPRNARQVAIHQDNAGFAAATGARFRTSKISDAGEQPLK